MSSRPPACVLWIGRFIDARYLRHQTALQCACKRFPEVVSRPAPRRYCPGNDDTFTHPWLKRRRSSDPNWRETDRPLLRLVGALRGAAHPAADPMAETIGAIVRSSMRSASRCIRPTLPGASPSSTKRRWSSGSTAGAGEEWCGSWRLFWPDGRPMRHDECPMAIALRENRAVRGWWAIAERPDGGRVAFQPFPTPLRDDAGNLVGAVNVLVDVTEQRRAQDALRATADGARGIQRGQGRIPRSRVARAADPGHHDLRQRGPPPIARGAA